MNEEAIRKAFEADFRLSTHADLCAADRRTMDSWFDIYSLGWQAATRAAAPAWLPIESMPNDGGTYLVADSTRGNVAPHIRGVIHNNAGTGWDWHYGEAITHWMPLPAAPEAKP